MQPVYLDYNATTPVAPEVLAAMMPFLTGGFGNPSSSHALGRQAHAAVERARAEVAGLIGAEPDEILFTSGGTEANNLAIRGSLATDDHRAIVTTAIEHPATEECCRLHEAAGRVIRRVAAGPDGIVRAADMAKAIDREAGLVTVILAQNEIGTVQPVADISALACSAGALIHTDAAQAVGKLAVDVRQLGVDLLSIAGHKLNAPKGIGALFIRRGVAVRPLLVGGGQERGIRPGTENVPYIVGLGAACALAGERLTHRRGMLAALSQRLLTGLRETVPGLVLVGDPERRLPNTLNVLFPGVSGRRLLETCPAVMASVGSACHADSEAPSAILTALGFERAAALGAVRLSLGWDSTPEDIDTAITELAGAWRSLASVRQSAA
ncbi:MAG: cysteine desulfurase NifS [Methylobacterium sp.]|nr:cysteine desulfurase NifS [Methylobacterium sp.]